MDFSIDLKHSLHQQCIEMVNQKVEVLRNAISDAREALTSESKSSAGDKHETGRAMLQLETEKNGQQLIQNIKLQEALNRISSKNPNTETIQAGTLVKTNMGIFYISVGIGKIQWDGQNYQAISPVAPIAQLLIGKRKGESIELNGNKIDVLDLI